MTQHDTPIGAMFDVQRSMIKESQQLFTQGFAGQHTADQLARAALDGQAALQRQQLEIAQAAAHGSVATMVAMVPGDKQTAHRGVDATFEQLKTAHEEFYDAMERELERDVDSADDVAAEFEEAMETGTEQFLEQLEQIQEMQAQFEHRTGDVEDLLDRQAEQMESLQRQLEEQATQAHEQTHGLDRGELNITVDVEHALEAIDGIGETTRERLVDAGISTVGDLTESDPETVADAAEVSTSRARNWIEQAEV